jgi:hypothetical protein
MNTKKVLAGSIIGSVVSFFLGWVVFGMLMGEVYKNGMVYYEGLMIDPPNLVAIFIGNLAFATLLSVLFDKMGIGTIVGGVIWAAIIFFLVMLGMDAFFYASMNLYKPMTLVIDVIVNTVFGAIMGAVIAFVMSKVS